MKIKRSRGDIKSLLSQIKDVLNGLYGERLVEMILYGSFARDEATQDSDIDIAVVLRGEMNKFKEIRRLNDATYHLMLEYGELVSFYPISEEELVDIEWPLHYYIQREGMKV
jgi:uncharacterized protein